MRAGTTPEEDEALDRRFERRQQTSALRAIARNVRGSIINKGLLLAAVLVVIDTLLVSHYQPATALALLRSTPPLTLLTGVLLNLGPVLMNVAIIVYLVRGASAIAQYRISTAVSCYGAAGLLAVFATYLVDDDALISPFVLLPLAAAMGVGGYVLSRGHEDNAESAPPLAVIIGLAVFLGYVITHDVEPALTRPYLPAERIEITDMGTKRTISEVGYVVDADRSWSTIMREDDRSIIYVRTTDLRSREVCLLPSDRPVRPRNGIELTAADVPTCG